MFNKFNSERQISRQTQKSINQSRTLFEESTVLPVIHQSPCSSVLFQSVTSSITGGTYPEWRSNRQRSPGWSVGGGGTQEFRYYHVRPLFQLPPSFISDLHADTIMSYGLNRLIFRRLLGVRRRLLLVTNLPPCFIDNHCYLLPVVDAQ